MSETPSSTSPCLNSAAATFGDDVQQPQLSPLPESIHPSLDTINTNTETTSNVNQSESLLAHLINSLPDNYDEELANDPNLADFIKFHNQIKDLNFDNNNNNNNNNKIFLKKIPKYNWEALSFAFEYIYKLYTDEITEILSDFDKLDIKRSIWQESAFRMDGERATKKFKSIESWVHDSDLYLNIMKKDLSSSVQIIRNTLEKLNNPKDHDIDMDLSPEPNATSTASKQ